jgi:hypothetical protein
VPRFAEVPIWTAKNRRRNDRRKLRYPSDRNDDEWAVIEPLIPPAKRGGVSDACPRWRE